MKRFIMSAQDFRTFDAYTWDEVEEWYPELYNDKLWEGIRDYVRKVFVSKNEDCDYVGILAVDGAYFICPLHSENPPLCEVDFEEFFDYLK